MQKKKKKNKLFIFLIICFVLVPFLLTKGCNYIESLNQAKNSVSERITSISEQIQPVSRVYTHVHERAHTRAHNSNVYAQMHSISKANWTGTTVPNSGYVENVYINTNLSVEDVNSILNDISFHKKNETYYYSLLSNEDLNHFIGINKVDNGYIIVYVNNEETNIIFDTTIYTQITGWNSEFANIINYNSNVVSYADGITSGDQNSYLSNLFSITPFEQSSNNELSIGNLFTQLGNAIIIFGGAVVNVFISMEPIFWNEGPTLIFILLIAAVSFALVFWGIELLISLIGVARTKRKKKK